MRALQRSTLYWMILALVAVLCCLLAIVQYRWTGELARADHERLRNGLQSALNILSRDFNAELATASTALQPSSEEIALQGREQAYSARYEAWRKSDSRGEMFHRIAIAVPGENGLDLRALDARTLSVLRCFLAGRVGGATECVGPTRQARPASAPVGRSIRV